MIRMEVLAQLSQRPQTFKRALLALLVGLCAEAFAAKWRSQHEVDVVTDKAVHEAWVSSQSRHGTLKQVALLGFRCSNNKLEAYIQTPFYTSIKNVSVITRFDKMEPKEEKWTPAKGGEGVFSPDPQTFLQAVTEHQRLIARVSPPTSGDETIFFDLVGAKQALVKIQKDCALSAGVRAHLPELSKYISDSLNGPMRLRSQIDAVDGQLTFSARLGSGNTAFTDFEEISSDLPPAFRHWLIQRVMSIYRHIGLDENLLTKSVEVEIRTHKEPTPSNEFTEIGIRFTGRQQ